MQGRQLLFSLDQISAELLTTDGQISGHKNKTKTAVKTKCQKTRSIISKNFKKRGLL